MGLQVVDIADPLTPSRIGSVVTPGEAYQVAVIGDLSFVADGSAGLQIAPAQCGATAAVGARPVPPTAPALLAARPNPTRGATGLQFELPQPTVAKLAIYDASGRRVRVLVDGPRAAGPHAVTWDGADDRGRPLTGGVYVARLSWPGGSTTSRLILVR
jgi:hypothetical protein